MLHTYFAPPTGTSLLRALLPLLRANAGRGLPLTCLLLLLLTLGAARAQAPYYYMSGNSRIVTCGGTVYGAPSNGRNGFAPIPPNTTSVLTIAPAAANSQATLTFSYVVLGNSYITVRIHNGASVAAPVLVELRDQQPPAQPVIASNPTGELTVEVISGPVSASSSSAYGFQAQISCSPSHSISAPGTFNGCFGSPLTDTGGSNGPYQNSENYVKTLVPSSPGNRVQLSFTEFDLESNYDFLRIYDGPNTSAPLLGTYTGTNSPGVLAARNATGQLTVQFTSDVSVTRPGFAASLACVAPPTITSFSTALSATGGVAGTLVYIYGTAFTGATAVTFNGVPATFVVDNSSRITTQVPAGATTGPITVTVPAIGTATSATNFVVPTPTISGFSPPSGPAGTVVTVTGTNFTGTTAVRFNGVSAASYTVNSSTQITATVPGGASTGPISVAAGSNGTGTSTTSFVVPAPTVSGFTPVSGPAGTIVTLTGTYFTGATAVRFTGANATAFTVNSATQITVTAPSGVLAGPVSVTSPAGTGTSTASFNAGSQNYLINGTGGVTACSGTLFDSGGANGPYQPYENYTRTLTPGTAGSKLQLRFAVFDTYSFTNEPYDPEEIDHLYVFDGPNTSAPLLGDFYGNTSSGYRSSLPGNVTATNATGQLTVQFVSGVADYVQYIQHAGFAADVVCVTPPTVSGFSPITGPAGTVVTVSGAGFTDASAVRFNGVDAASFTVNSPTQITATVPTGATTGTIAVTTPVGTGSSVSSFTVLLPPTISGFTPPGGAGGTLVTITGTSFANTSAVTFNGVSAAAFTVNSSTQITATAPNAVTSGRLKVTTPIGFATSATDFTASAPTLTGVSPVGGAAGTVVTLTGTGLTTATAVSFNGVDAPTFTVNSATQITVTVPASAATGLVRVATPNGTAVSPSAFTVPTPTITSFSPVSGPAGTAVVLTGTGFLGVTDVRFNGVASVDIAVNSATQLTVTVPNAATTGLIAVTAPAGTGSSATSFIVSAPTITNFSPGTGPAGTVVTLTGTGLLATTGVRFNGVVAAYTVVSATQVTATVPATATSGAITLTTAAGTATSATGFVVPPPPTISGFTPVGGPAGTVVTITGSGFSGASAVAFGGVNAPGFTINSNTQLTVTVPATATTGPLTVATTANGVATSATSFAVPAPTISSFTPPSGPAGTVVTITGTGFGAATAVGFNGTGAASFTINSNTQLTATVPGGAVTGPLSVTAPSGTGTSAGIFDTGNYLVSVPTALSVCAGTLYDSGGPNGYYQAFENNTRTLSPGTPGRKVQLTFTTFLLNTDGLGNDDYVDIYDGPDTNAPLLARLRSIYYAQPTGSYTASNAAGQLTVRFFSFNASAPGFAATIACVVPPAITSFSPGSGPAGTVVTITGSGFSGATAVAFQGTAATYTVNSATQITATVPTVASTGRISVTGANAAVAYSATAFDTGKYLISAAGSLTTCAGTIYDSGGPDEDYIPGDQYTRTLLPGTAGSRVQLTFTDFDLEYYYGTDYLTVYNGTDTNAPVLGTFTGGALPGTFTATNAAGALTLGFRSGVIARNSFRGFAATVACVPGPAISSFTPGSGPAGTAISLTGTNLTGATAITFAGTAGNVVTTGFVVASATSITGIVVPAGAVTGPLTVTTALGPSLPSTQLFYLPPTLSAVVPAAELPGTTVVLTGTNFASGSSVSFGGVGGTNVNVLSATSLTVTVPAGASVGSAPVVVSTAGFGSGSMAFTVLGVYSGGAVGTCAPAVPSTASLNDGQWHYLLSAGQVVAAYSYTGVSLGNLAMEVLRADPAAAVRKDPKGHAYLDRNFHLTASVGAFTGRTVKLRLYGLSAELARLQGADNTATAATLKATQYSGANEDCALANNVASGERRVLPAPASSPAGAPWFVAELAVADHFSEFYLTGASTPLPVVLTQFTAIAQGPGAVRLAWNTATEQNSQAFEVERSADGTTFAPVGTVPAAGSSAAPRSYELLDSRLPSGTALLYYRLRQVDRDGTAAYSGVRTVDRNAPAEAAQLQAFPNPAHDAVQVRLLGPAATDALTLYDALGRQVLRQPAPVSGAEARLSLQGLPTGVYVLRCGTLALRLAVE